MVPLFSTVPSKIPPVMVPSFPTAVVNRPFLMVLPALFITASLNVPPLMVPSLSTVPANTPFSMPL